MTTIVTRAGKGSPLTHVEVDANFTNLNNDKLDVAGIALGSAASPTLKFTGDTNTGLYSPGADQVALATGGVGRLFVDASGRIGIGAPNPGSALDVVGAGNFTTQVGVWGGTIGQPQTVIEPGKITAYAAGVGAGNLLLQSTGGNVGIGTSSPTHLLSVGIGGSGGSTYPIALGQTAGVPSARIDGYKVDGSYAGELHLYTATGAGAQNRAITIDSSQRVGIGTTAPNAKFEIANGHIRLTSAYRIGTGGTGGTPDKECIRFSDGSLDFLVANTERARIDSSGRLLVGTSSSVSAAGGQAPFQLFRNNVSELANLHLGFNGSSAGARLVVSRSRNTTHGSYTILQSGDEIGGISFAGDDGASYNSIAARIFAEVDGTPGANDMPGRLVFSTTADGASSPTERMRITNNGLIKGGSTTVNPGVLNTAVGFEFSGNGYGIFSRSSNAGLIVSRTTDDGSLVDFWQDGNIEGNIAISGTTVSYNGAHLSRWSQLPSGAERTEILRGTVLSNIDEMCEWGEEDNEQLNRMKVSDVESDANVAGVFQAWDDDDDTYTNDFYCAMTGDFIIRIGAGVSVQRGDLLMSAGDGTAKPQGDDIVRSKTVAKVTSTNVSCTYDDGSYCVPCVLMTC